MKTYARIQEGAVAELFSTDGDIKQMFHPELIWVEAPEGTQEGDIFQDGKFSRPDPVESPHVVPSQVSRAQGKAALIQAGMWQAVLDHVAGIEDPTQQALARVALDDTTEWRRDSPFLATAAAALGLTDQQLDDLFVAAAAIVL